ncbi:hypothetical protein B0H63DRAFT_544670 [Podospora didyma]|uniref:Uncharacterized protein n=1 Tax=Podospora didyma TaxID=330526 RepID=A0AAE0NQY6_9PEZI|nr:hypothetical protein B0H63DRAFT_544670 [Podospora didyma]
MTLDLNLTSLFSSRKMPAKNLPHDGLTRNQRRNAQKRKLMFQVAELERQAAREAIAKNLAAEKKGTSAPPSPPRAALSSSELFFCAASATAAVKNGLSFRQPSAAAAETEKVALPTMPAGLKRGIPFLPGEPRTMYGKKKKLDHRRIIKDEKKVKDELPIRVKDDEPPIMDLARTPRFLGELPIRVKDDAPPIMELTRIPRLPGEPSSSAAAATTTALGTPIPFEVHIISAMLDAQYAKQLRQYMRTHGWSADEVTATMTMLLLPKVTPLATTSPSLAMNLLLDIGETSYGELSFSPLAVGGSATIAIFKQMDDLLLPLIDERRIADAISGWRPSVVCSLSSSSSSGCRRPRQPPHQTHKIAAQRHIDLQQLLNIRRGRRNRLERRTFTREGEEWAANALGDLVEMCMRLEKYGMMTHYFAKSNARLCEMKEVEVEELAKFFKYVKP